MAILWMDGFELYGTGVGPGADGDAVRQRMLDNVYASVTGQAGISEAQAGTGIRSLYFQAINGQEVRRAFPSALGEVFVGFRLFAQTLPDATNRVAICQLRDISNTAIMTVALLPDGSMAVRNGDLNAANVAVTSGPVVGAGAQNHVEVRAVQSSGTVEIRVNEVQVLSNATFTFNDPFSLWALEGRNAAGAADYYFEDLIVNDTSGTYNTSWKGDLRVSTIYPDNEETPNGWTQRGKRLFSQGVLEIDDGLIFSAGLAGTDVGTDDFTIECWIRIDEAFSGAQAVFSKWIPSISMRGFLLFFNNGNLNFNISTNGVSATNIFNLPAPQIRVGVYYHLAVTRASGVTRAFIDGRQLGGDAADTNSYFTGASMRLAIGGLIDENDAVRPGFSFPGTIDEFRFTVGVARYTANFTPPTAIFPRSAPGDPDFSSVQVLMGYDALNFADESSVGRLFQNATGSNSVALDVQEEAQGKWTVIDDAPPDDSTYIAADFTFAQSALTVTANPTATETVTLGALTYTFVAALASANDILIGATASDSLDNLVAAINGGAGEGTTYGTGTPLNTQATAIKVGADQLLATAQAQGAAGNSIVTSETLANGSWAGVTVGVDIPPAQQFSFSPLPLDTTQVRAIQLVQRSAKSDAAVCRIQTSFHVSAASDLGDDRPITTAFAYWSDIFEEDPDTTAGLTVNSLTAGQFRINRTA